MRNMSQTNQTIQEKVESVVEKMNDIIDDEDMREHMVAILYDLTGMMTNTERAQLAEKL